MKKIIFCTIIIGMLAIQSCTEKNESEGIQTQAEPQMSLVGKVYGLTAVSDTTKCSKILPGNIFLPRLLFLDNSSFIKIIPIECIDLGKDFTCSRYYCGKYKLDDSELTLTFEPNMVMHYIKLKRNTKSKPVLSTHVELEKSDLSIEKLLKSNCKNIPYFQPCGVQGYLMTPTSDTLTNHIKYLIDEKIWGNLFGIN